MFGGMPEESAAVQMEEEDGHDEDDNQGGGEEKDDGQEAGLVGGQLLDLNLLQAIRKVLRVLIGVRLFVFHVALDVTPAEGEK